MNMFDEAKTIAGMIEMCNMTQSEVAKKLGVSQSYVGNKVRLLKLPERARDMILLAGLTERHARALVRIDDEGMLIECIEKVCEGRMTVAECEALVDVYVEARVPYFIGVAPRRERVLRFEEALGHSIESLRSAGIVATKSTDCYGKKKYILISIEEYI